MARTAACEGTATCTCVVNDKATHALLYYLVRCIWPSLATRFGNKYFLAYEWCMKTEYQGRGAPHWHICAWIVSFAPLSDLNGRTGKAAELAGYAVSRDTARASRKAQRQGAFGLDLR